MKVRLKEHTPGSKADVFQTIWVGVAVVAALPLLLAVAVFGGDLAVLAGGGLVLWGALVGRHLWEAVRDGVAAYHYAKASNAWSAK